MRTATGLSLYSFPLPKRSSTAPRLCRGLAPVPEGGSDRRVVLRLAPLRFRCQGLDLNAQR